MDAGCISYNLLKKNKENKENYDDKDDNNTVKIISIVVMIIFFVWAFYLNWNYNSLCYEDSIKGIGKFLRALLAGLAGYVYIIIYYLVLPPVCPNY